MLANFRKSAYRLLLEVGISLRMARVSQIIMLFDMLFDVIMGSRLCVQQIIPFVTSTGSPDAVRFASKHRQFDAGGASIPMVAGACLSEASSRKQPLIGGAASPRRMSCLRRSGQRQGVPWMS